MNANWRRVFSGIVLAALLLLLALRLGGAETLRETLSQKMANITAANKPRGPDNIGPIPVAGPAFTASYAAVALLLAGAAALLAGGSMALRRIGQALLIALILTLLGISAAHAGNRFNAIVGGADMATALAAAWTLAVLCDDALLGKTGRQAVLAAVVAILAMGAAKALMQYFFEFPDLAQFIKDHPEQRMLELGMNPNDTVQKTLFMGRVKSQEVSGFANFSNVFATQMIGLGGLLAALLMAALRRPKAKPAPGQEALGQSMKSPKKNVSQRPSQPQREASPQVSAFVLELVLLGVLALAAIAVMPMTESKGGTAAGILCVVVIVAGGIFGRRIAARRRTLLGLAGAGAAALTAVVILYGQAHHGLPTKSLLFRWQYWTASVPIIREFPAWGTGLNNFGDYYLQYKAPSSPEDVKDPHNFFLRLAAEAGLPAMLAVAALLLWLLWESFAAARVAMQEPEAERREFAWPGIVAAGAVALAWALLRMLGMAYTDFEFIMSFLYAALGLLVFVGVFHLLWHLEDAGTRPGEAGATRFVALAGAIAALAMLLYDQVNMALVTGSCAMLFWMLLAVGDASRGDGVRRAPRGLAALIGGAALLGSAAMFLLLGAAPCHGCFALDPAPQEYAYIRQYNALNADLGRQDQFAAAAHAALARQALDRAIALSPTSGELYTQRIALDRFLTQNRLASIPLAPDIRKVLSLDRANARIRLELALPDSDLPKDERIAALQDALTFDAALPADEAKRLTDAQKAEVRDKIAALRGSSG